MTNDNDFFQQYLGDLNTQAQNANGQPADIADPGTLSGNSSQGQRPTKQMSNPQDPSGTAQQSGEAEGQSTGPSGDSEAGASPHVKEGLQQDTGNSDSKTATTAHKHAAKLRSQDLQEKNRKAQRRFRERQKVQRRSSRESAFFVNGCHSVHSGCHPTCSCCSSILQLAVWHRITCNGLTHMMLGSIWCRFSRLLTCCRPKSRNWSRRLLSNSAL